MLQSATPDVNLGARVGHPARMRPKHRKSPVAPAPAMTPLQADLATLNVTKQSAIRGGKLVKVKIGETASRYAKVFSTGGSYNGGHCDLKVNETVVLTVTPPRSDSADSVAVELARVEFILMRALAAGIPALDLRVSSSAVVRQIVSTLPSPHRGTTEQIQQLLGQFESVILRAESTTPLVRGLRARKATSWRKTEQGTLVMVRFGQGSQALAAVAHSDAGVRDSCCTYGGIIREKGEVIGMVMERAADTDNVVAAELLSLARILEEASSLGVKTLEVRVDCRAVLGHVVLNSKGACGDAAQRVRAQLGNFESLMFTAVRRELNKEADSLATSARDVYAPEPVEAIEPEQVVLPSRKSMRAAAASSRPRWTAALRRVWGDIVWGNPFALGIIIR